MMWRTQPIDLERWIAEYCTSRYGAFPEPMREAWSLLRQTAYGPRGVPDSTRYMTRPNADAGCEAGPDLTAMRRIVNLYLDGAERFGRNPLYRRDLVDVTKRFLEECAADVLDRAMAAYEDRDAARFEAETTRYVELLQALDELLSALPEYRLSTWIAAARRWGRDAGSADLYEHNARMQVTVWGGPVLHDYARKEWSGLTAGFYAERWRRFFDELRRAMKTGGFDAAAWDKSIAEWELSWTRRTDLQEERPPADVVSFVRALMEKYRTIQESPPAPAGIAVGKPETVSGGTEGWHKPEFVVDGRASNRDAGWYASPYPQWLQIDLQAPATVGRVEIFTYWDGQRHYQYTVDASMDGQTWTRLVDMSRNTTPAARRGRSHTFPPTKARYIRVNMLFNSANVGVHLLEVRVFPPD